MTHDRRADFLLESEQVAEFDCRQGCKKGYPMVVVRKNLSVEKGELINGLMTRSKAARHDILRKVRRPRSWPSAVKPR